MYYFQINIWEKVTVTVGALVNKPLIKSKNSFEFLIRHSNVDFHKLSMFRREQFIKTIKNKILDVVTRLDSFRKGQYNKFKPSYYDI